MMPAANAQTLTGQISGAVVDAGGASVPDADVQITNDVSKVMREFKTNANGTFTFPDLNTGSYSVHVVKQGFKAYDTKNIVLASGETLDLHELKLQVGDVTTSVSVEANAARIQTDSADRFTTVEQTAVEEIPNPQRFFLAATRTMPGAAVVSTTGSNGAGGVDGTNQLGSGGANTVLMLDGIVQQDSGAPSTGVTSSGRFAVNNDSVNQVQVQVNIMNAEFGSRAGGQVTVTTKNGTNQFHGSLYTYLRNEDFNANTWSNNRSGVAIARYRYQNPGGTFSGPVLLPWLKFNRSRTKMYFFYAEDWLRNKNQGAPVNFTMPTSLEKAGDFSDTVQTNGSLIKILQPGTSTQFPNNIIPPSQLNPEGQAFMNLFPTGCAWNSGTARGTLGTPNFAGIAVPCIIDPATKDSGSFVGTTGHGYNTQIYPIQNIPQVNRTLRVDYNLTPKTTMYVRLIQNLYNTIGVGAGQFLGGTNWGQFVNTNPQNGRGDVISMIHTFSPTFIMDATVGANFLHQQNQANDATAFAKQSTLSNFVYPQSVGAPLAGTLVNPTQVFGGNYLNLIPNVNLGTNQPQSAGQGYVSSTPAFGFDTRWPFDGTELTENYSTNWTNIRGKHTIKFGFNLEHGARNVSVYENYTINGTYYFGSDTGNPGNTNYPLSNLLLGQVQSYGQDNVKQTNHARYYQYEWYLQDTYKISRRVTLDYGVRFQVIPQIYSAGALLGLFNPKLYDPTKAGTLLMPHCTVALPASGTCPTANLNSINPKTGAVYPYVDFNHFDPASWTGTPFSGIQTFPDGKIFNTQHPQIGPRFGFAWDVFGDGKTSVRGGFGIFYNRAYSVDTIAASGGTTGPIKVFPNFQSPTYFNQTFASLAGAQAFVGPQTFLGGNLNMPDPTTNSWSIGIQRDMGKGYVLEVGYVGNNTHHANGTNFNQNGIYPGTVWSPNGGTCNNGFCTGSLNPQYVNPVQTTQPLPINLLRTFPGYYNGLADITTFTANGSSTYNALQEQLNKRFGKSFQFSSNWTWQKTTAINPNQYLAQQLVKTVAGRKQAVNIQLNYSVPSFSKLIGKKNWFTEGVFDGWKVDGVLSYFSGNPDGVTCSTPTNAPAGAFTGQDGVGSGVPYRCAITGPVFLPAGTGPSASNSNAVTSPQFDKNLWYPINYSSFALPGLGTYGFGNSPQVLFWGPGYENEDVSVYKAFRLKKENQQLILRADITNIRNHFNPGDPSTTIGVNYNSPTIAGTNTLLNTNTTFGSVTGQTGVPRQMSLSLRLKF
jgi:hypothetical protein